MKRHFITTAAIALLGGATALAFTLAPTSAQAKGCGGYVNVAVWGCAPWDNNPPKKGVTPGYGAPGKVAAPVKQIPVAVQKPAAPVIRPNAGNGIVSQGGGNIVSQGGGNLVSQGGGNIKH